jgi:electron transfer flavoprotein alpha subunit
MNCVNLAIDRDSKLLVMTRPVYGGNAIAEIVCNNSFPQIATVRVKTMTPLERDNSRECDTVPLKIEVDSSAVKILGREKEKETTGIKLEDAEVVVSGGRGMGEEAFDELSQIAKILHGAIGGTRGICDRGQIPTANQIGLTGKIVAPKLYIAIGLSGSSQHLSGCSGSKTIVAINTDPDANIFNVADHGIVGDYKEVLPALTKTCRELFKKDASFLTDDIE